MKKPPVLIILLFLLAFPAFVRGQLSENQKWIEQVDGGFVVPGSTAVATNYSAGVGGDLLVGYRFNHDLSLSADLGYYDCDQKVTGANGGEWIYVPVLAVLRCNFGPRGWVRPFVSFGAGVAVNSYTLSPGYAGKLSKRETDLLLAPGGGVIFIVSRDTALYVQARFDLNFSSPQGPWSDSPTLFVPIKGGVSFFVL